MERKDVQKKIKEITDKAKGIIAQAEKENRGLKDEELADIERLTADCRRAEAVIDAMDDPYHPERQAAALAAFNAACDSVFLPDTSKRVERPTPSMGWESSRPIYHNGVRASGQFLASNEPLAGPGGRPHYADRLSVGNMLRGIATSDWRGLEIEAQALGGGTPSAGGYLIPSFLAAEVIDLARAQSVLIQAGSRTLPIEGETRIPKILTDPVLAWRSENAAITSTSMTFGAVKLQPRSLAGLVTLSNELLEDGVGVDAIVRNVLAKVIAREIDRSGLNGSGINAEPLGILNHDGLSEVVMGESGAAINDYSEILEGIELSLTANVKPVSAIYHPRTQMALEGLLDGDDNPRKAPPSFEGLAKFVTTSIPVDMAQGGARNASCVLLGDFSNVIFATRSDMRIEFVPWISLANGEGFEKNQSVFRVTVRCDWAVGREADLTIIRGIIPAA